MAMLARTTSVRSACSRRSKRSSTTSSLLPVTQQLSNLVNIDDIGPNASMASLFSCESNLPADDQPRKRGKRVHSKLLLEDAARAAAMARAVDVSASALKPAKRLRRRPSTHFYSCHSTYESRARNSVSSNDTLLLLEPAPLPQTLSLETLSYHPGRVALPTSWLQPTAASSPYRRSEHRKCGIFGAAAPVRQLDPLATRDPKRRRITPPLSKYKYASTLAEPASPRASLPLLLPRNLVDIPAFFPPRARLTAEFSLYGYLTHLHKCAQRAPKPPSPLAASAHYDQPRSRPGHKRSASLGSLRTAHARASLVTFRSLRQLRLPSAQDRHAMQLAHLAPLIEAERVRVFERIQALKRDLAASGGGYAERDMRRAQHDGARLAKDTLPRILHMDVEFDDWVLVGVPRI